MLALFGPHFERIVQGYRTVSPLAPGWRQSGSPSGVPVTRTRCCSAADTGGTLLPLHAAACPTGTGLTR